MFRMLLVPVLLGFVVGAIIHMRQEQGRFRI